MSWLTIQNQMSYLFNQEKHVILQAQIWILRANIFKIIYNDLNDDLTNKLWNKKTI